MNLKAGIVCGNCDQLNPVDGTVCSACGFDLSLNTGTALSADNATKAGDRDNQKLQDVAPAGKEDDEMEQARHYVCDSCYSPVPAGHKFCGKCGKPLSDNIVKDPDFFSDLQTPGKAKLILVKGEGMDGMSYHLNSTEHLAGRSNGEIIFGDDALLSPTHANFFYSDGVLKVRDEDSLNGVFLAIKTPVQIPSGTVFMAGEQLFRVEEVASVPNDAEADGTFFFASPFHPATFRVVQILEGGGDGIIVNARDNVVLIGREDTDMNFPSDPYISGNHVKVEATADGLQITDLESKNGTFIRIQKEQALIHGDYLFLGHQLLRIEITN